MDINIKEAVSDVVRKAMAHTTDETIRTKFHALLESVQNNQHDGNVVMQKALSRMKHLTINDAIRLSLAEAIPMPQGWYWKF